MKDKDILISVVMPVHNCGAYIQEAIESVLLQTFPYFEFIIVNDGSTDDTGLIAHSYTDKRIKLIDFETNRGCYPARNTGMRMAKGRYVCVMDGDDICLPGRFETQYRFLEENPEYGMVGSAFKYINFDTSVYKEVDYDTIKLMLLQYCYLLHPTCMVRKSFVEKYNLYYEENFIFASDYAWQVKASSLFPVTNINKILLLYRTHEKQISKNKSSEQGRYANEIRIRQLNDFGITLIDIEKPVVLSFMTKRGSAKKEESHIIEKFMNDMIEINLISNYYYHERLILKLDELWEQWKRRLI